MFTFVSSLASLCHLASSLSSRFLSVDPPQATSPSLSLPPTSSDADAPEAAAAAATAEATESGLTETTLSLISVTSPAGAPLGFLTFLALVNVTATLPPSLALEKNAASAAANSRSSDGGKPPSEEGEEEEVEAEEELEEGTRSTACEPGTPRA